MRYFIEIAYKGTAYHGWQKQNNALGVQEVLEKYLGTLLRQTIETTGGGRTDTGVHCRRQFVHFDAEINLSKEVFLKSINGMLPHDISIGGIWAMPAEANARFDAISRSYEYHIVFSKNPFEHGFSFRLQDRPDVQAMNEAARLLMRYEDFQSFSKVRTQVNNFVCHIHQAVWKEEAGKLVFYITANRFLRGMVRALVGTMLEVGKHRLSLEGLEGILQQKDRRAAAAAVPPEGLYLMDVRYPEGFFGA